jgi:hypothetical protein
MELVHHIVVLLGGRLKPAEILAPLDTDTEVDSVAT